MAMASGGKKGRTEEEDHISRLPDAILGEIVSLLPTKDGGRTQILSSRWRPLWRSAPLNINLHDLEPQQGRRRIRPDELAGILSSHWGPGRRFSIPLRCFDGDRRHAATLDGWLRSPALDGLQELDFHYTAWFPNSIAPAPASALRFSSSLRAASFGGCTFPDGNAAGAPLYLPLLEKLSLLHVRISETSLYALLAGCPVLQSLLLTADIGWSSIRIVSQTLRSICVRSASLGEKTTLQQFIIEDAPSLERLLLFTQRPQMEFVLSVISAPRLEILGQIPEDQPKLEFGFGSTMVFQGSCVVNSTIPGPNVKVLALTHSNLSLDVAIDFMKCFPHLEKLYIKTAKLYIEPTKPAVTNAWCRKYQNLISTLDIRLKKVVVTTYRGNRAHVNFAKFFVLNARVLESMVLDIKVRNNNKEWIERQHALLKLHDRASRSARIDFVSHDIACPSSLDHIWSEQVHNLSTNDPFVRFNVWT